MRFGRPQIDLFASRLNTQCLRYASWRPDPEALYVDAFSVNWNKFFFYAFPPFSLIGRCLKKILENQAQGILVVPLWKSQSWYPKLLRLLMEPPAVTEPRRTLLTLPGIQQLHPLWEKRTLLACHLCGNSTKTENFQQKLPALSYNHGVYHHRNNTRHISVNGYHSVLKGRLIQVCTTLSDALDFLTLLYDKNLSYS